MLELTGIDITRCPLCQNGTLVLFVAPPVLAALGFFVMIAQRTNTRVRARFSSRANASVRLVSSFLSSQLVLLGGIAS